ncbi:hypothetical protein D1872_233960 [compost metagenome]
MQWRNDKDDLLSDLCRRFIDRKLYKYVEVDSLDKEMVQEIREAFIKEGLHPEYDLEIDFPTDLPYDVFRPDGEIKDKQILLLDRHERIREISEVSDIVRSISGLHRGKFHLYYPDNKLSQIINRLPQDIADIFEQK